MKKQFVRKKHRLDSSYYIGLVRVTVTICIEGRKEIFVTDKVCNTLQKFLGEELQKERVINLAYIFMPDHIHLILEGTDEKSNILNAIKMFKQRVGFWLKTNYEVMLQKSFYDYIHRKDDKLAKHIRYIFENPIRKRIVEDFKEYKYLGSLDYNIDEIL